MAEEDNFENSTKKGSRRSSLGIGLLAGRGLHDSFGKRRSSISIAFLGRRDQNKGKDASCSYESVVKCEKSDAYDDALDADHSNNDTFTAENFQNIFPHKQNGTYEKNRRRRHSTLQTKLERQRRKNDPPISELDDSLKLTSSSTPSGRQKKNSWWNIFVPEPLRQRERRTSQDVRQAGHKLTSKHQKGRRASQDATMLSASTGVLSQKPRSKSISVDHSLSVPFDFVTFRSKIGAHVEEEDTDYPKERTRRSIPGRLNTEAVTYHVGRRDTITKIAAQFDTTPSELAYLNRLHSSVIHPGQHLIVPMTEGMRRNDGGDYIEDEDSHGTEDLHDQKSDVLDGLRSGSPKPGHIERVASPKGQKEENEDPVITQRFLKINVRHITDGQGVVGGVLLVTPNAVMFDPNVSDPLVIEHGPESYGVIAPMDLVVNAAIFNDIAHMRVAGREESHNPEKAEIYYPKHAKVESLSLSKDETSSNLLELGSIESCDDQESVCSSTGRGGDAFPKAFEQEKVTPEKTEAVDPIGEYGALNKTEDDSNDGIKSENELLANSIKSLEERRQSLLDHHWAVPIRELSIDQEKPKLDEEKLDSLSQSEANVDKQRNSTNINIIDTQGTEVITDETEEPVVVKPSPAKREYSDADIVLSSDWAPPRAISPPLSAPESILSQLSQTANLPATPSYDSSGGRKKTSSVSFSVEENKNSQPQPQTSDKTSDKKIKMLKRLSYPLTWVEGLAGDSGKSGETESAPSTADSNQSVFSKVFSSSPITLVSELSGNLFMSKTPSEDSGGSPVPPLTPRSDFYGTSGRSSIGTFIRPHSTEGNLPAQKKEEKRAMPKLDYRSMVSIDDMPELFASFDKLIPRPARACQDPPLYLRLRMGRPIGKSVPLPTSVMSYGKNKLRPEYWFSVPKNRVDELYKFMNSWVPHLYGELDEEQITVRGFELIEHDTEWMKNDSAREGDKSGEDDEDIKELTRESWELLKTSYDKFYNIIKTAGSHELERLGEEVLSVGIDEHGKSSIFATGSFDLDFPIPDLIGKTEILTEDHREKLCAHLPARAEGYSWTLVFSTSQHGFSLNSLYRKMKKLESPVLIVVEDTTNNVFGALTSCSLHVSDHFYGTGESLLFKFNPTFQVFNWTGENLFFIQGTPDNLSVGAGDGKFGLWLDGDLNQGRSQSCSTYANEPLAPEEDFVVKTLECWAFI